MALLALAPLLQRDWREHRSRWHLGTWGPAFCMYSLGSLPSVGCGDLPHSREVAPSLGGGGVGETRL